MNHFTVADFWAQQSFFYIETYSFNRGPKSAEKAELLQTEIAKAKIAHQRARFMQQTKLANKLHQLEEAMRGGEYRMLLPEPDDIPDFTSQRVALLPQDSAVVEQLNTLLLKAKQQEAFAACPPIYRDALAFYVGNGQRVAVLNICFECLSMATDDNKLVEANFATYDALRELLIELGHPIELPDK